MHWRNFYISGRISRQTWRFPTRPYSIPNKLSIRRWGWLRRITLQSLFLHKSIELFHPKHPAKRLPHNLLQIVATRAKNEWPMKLISLLPPLFYHIVENYFIFQAEILTDPRWREFESDNRASAMTGHIMESIMSSGFCTFFSRLTSEPVEGQGVQDLLPGFSAPNNDAVLEQIRGDKNASGWESDAGGRLDGMIWSWNASFT